jgi:hypothetical protein
MDTLGGMGAPTVGMGGAPFGGGMGASIGGIGGAPFGGGMGAPMGGFYVFHDSSYCSLKRRRWSFIGWWHGLLHVKRRDDKCDAGLHYFYLLSYVFVVNFYNHLNYAVEL